MHEPAPLTPNQASVLAKLRDGDRPVYGAEVRQALHAELTDELAPHARVIGDGDPLWVGKHQLGQIHACEGHWDAERGEEFAWSVATAKGTVAHRAIELSMFHAGTPLPGDLVDDSIGYLTSNEASIGDYLQRLPAPDLAALKVEANASVAAFLDTFPPLRRAWRPVAEAKLRVELFDRRIVLSGRPDLMIGTAQGTQAGRVIIDLKTGGFSPAHRDDVRFYGLLDTLRTGVPPFRVATFYLESGELHCDDVDEGVLRAQIRRVVDGVDRMLAVREGARDAELRPGPVCHWCVARPTCPAPAPDTSLP